MSALARDLATGRRSRRPVVACQEAVSIFTGGYEVRKSLLASCFTAVSASVTAARRLS
jgi:hypothetical protein